MPMKRIQKRTAKRYYDNGAFVGLKACRLDNAHIIFYNKQGLPFYDLVAIFEKLHCNHENGLYAWYYIEED